MLELLWQGRAYAQYAVFGLLFLLALWKGNAPERICNGTFVMMALADRIYHRISGEGTYWSLDVGHLAIDVAGFVPLYFVAIRANRIYPLWLAAAQIIALLSHVSRAAMPEVNETAYALMIRMPSYIQIAALVLGLVSHIRRKARVGSYPSWVCFSNRSPQATTLPSPNG